ncbi:T9SS type A sorting domain-containing protein [Hymenobacter sp. DG25A]|uniref:T9SS type A sorting domain-containing protein n=1 Tax=Hymenobacter sp. DG25A TaxID=1385663 RepID=UPI000ADF5370|nr:T9SS type A sorting domain-containing protein [Hymenobacter sp. DG25A]
MSSTSHTPIATVGTIAGSCRTNLFSFLTLLLTVLLTSSAFAQTPSLPVCKKNNGATYLPHCTSNDLSVTGAFLTADQCYCSDGDNISATLNFKLFNKTGSFRTSFAFFAILESTDSEGNVSKQYITRCKSGVPGGSESIISFDDPISVECGASLKLTNVYLAWTDASDRRVCDLAFCDIAPKCGKPLDITITSLLTADVEATASCDNSPTGSLAITPSGGTSPYDILVKDSNGGTVATYTNVTGTQTIEDLAADDYSISVTDAATPENCTYNTTKSVSSIACCVAPDKPAICQTPADLCGDGKISLTISNAVVGDWYIVFQGTTKDSIQAESSTITFNGLTPGGKIRVYGVDVKNGTRCKGPEANCDNTTIGTCSADFSARSSSSAQTLAPTKQRNIRTEVYPNPTGRDATINFSVPKSGHVLVRVYNALGEPVATLLDGEVKGGENRALVFRGDKLPSGTYYYKVTANGKTKTNRISLSK